MFSDKELMTVAANALFTHNQDGRMVRVNEPDGEVAPRFYMGRTGAGNLWRFRHDLPAEVVQQLDALCAREPITANLRQPPTHFDALRAVLESHAPVRVMDIGPEYYFPDAIWPSELATRLTSANADVLQPHFAWIIPHLGLMPPVFAVVRDGRAVAVCFSSRTTPLADQAGVETVEGFRGRGYAPAVVGAWASAIRDLGRIPLYGTSWDNLASQGVARKLKLMMYGESLSMM